MNLLDRCDDISPVVEGRTGTLMGHDIFNILRRRGDFMRMRMVPVVQDEVQEPVEEAYLQESLFFLLCTWRLVTGWTKASRFSVLSDDDHRTLIASQPLDGLFARLSDIQHCTAFQRMPPSRRVWVFIPLRS